MQPPSAHADDFRHCFQKLTAYPRPPATIMANITSRPPPSYTAAIAAQDINQYDDEEYDEHDDNRYGHDDTAENYTTTTPSFPVSSTTPNTRTITINLDSSIHIHGDGNTLTIASGQGQRQAQAQAQTQTQTQTRIQPQASNPKSKVANTTASIITALQQSGILATRPDSGSGSGLGSAFTSVQVNIDAGIKVRGFQNVVCFGALMVPTTSARESKANIMKTTDARKRRAQSEPATVELEMKRYKRS
ncbi:hypothetical protein BDW66DRAFT_143286 [Aspergillus desertorum]